MKPVEVSLEQVLLARENRAGRQQRLLAQYGLPLVSFTMNMAGPVKDTPLSRFAFQAGVAALTKRLGGPVSCCLTEAVTGCEALLVYDRPAQVLKDVCMELESTEVGRLYDLDVLDAAGEKLSRIWIWHLCSAAQRRSGRGFAGWSASGWTTLHLRSCRMQDGRQRQRCCRRPAA